jgi:hypothetical protein
MSDRVLAESFHALRNLFYKFLYVSKSALLEDGFQRSGSSGKTKPLAESFFNIYLPSSILLGCIDYPGVQPAA